MSVFDETGTDRKLTMRAFDRHRSRQKRTHIEKVMNHSSYEPIMTMGRLVSEVGFAQEVGLACKCVSYCPTLFVECAAMKKFRSTKLHRSAW